MPAIPQGYGPHGVPDPPCIENLRVGFLLGSLIGLAAGGLFASTSWTVQGLRGFALMKKMSATTWKMAAVFGTFGLIGNSLRCLT